MENATFEIYWRDINIHAKVATKGWAKAPLKYSEKDAFLRMFLEKEKTRICSTSSNFSQRRAIQQEWNKTVFAYILLFRLSSISYFIPPSSFVHIFFSTQYREFYGEFCTNSCWKLCHCFIIDISATLNKSRSNWKYSIRAPCFYIFASSMVGFFRSWLGNPSPPFERCVWNSSRVCVHPPRRFAETLSPMFIFPSSSLPRGSFQSFWIEEYVLLYYLYRESELRLPLYVYVTWLLQLSVNLQRPRTSFPSLFPCNDLAFFPPLPPFNYIISKKFIMLVEMIETKYRFNRRKYFSS